MASGEDSDPECQLQIHLQHIQTYPNRCSYLVSVGKLALGAPRLRDTSSGLSLNMIAALLYTPNEPHSYSYSVYIRPVESADPGISCSRRVPPDSVGWRSKQPVDCRLRRVLLIDYRTSGSALQKLVFPSRLSRIHIEAGHSSMMHMRTAAWSTHDSSRSIPQSHTCFYP